MVVPALTPVTLPDASTVATPVTVLLQVPPVADSDNDTTSPAQMVDAPEITPGAGKPITDILAMVLAVPHAVLTE